MLIQHTLAHCVPYMVLGEGPYQAHVNPSQFVYCAQPVTRCSYGSLNIVIPLCIQFTTHNSFFVFLQNRGVLTIWIIALITLSFRSEVLPISLLAANKPCHSSINDVDNRNILIERQLMDEIMPVFLIRMLKTIKPSDCVMLLHMMPSADFHDYTSHAELLKYNRVKYTKRKK